MMIQAGTIVLTLGSGLTQCDDMGYCKSRKKNPNRHRYYKINYFDTAKKHFQSSFPEVYVIALSVPLSLFV